MRLEETSCLHVDEGGARLFPDGVLGVGPVRVPTSVLTSVPTSVVAARDARCCLLCFT